MSGKSFVSFCWSDGFVELFFPDVFLHLAKYGVFIV